MNPALSHVRFPLVVAEGLDVSFYERVDALETDLEWIDVRDGIYQAWDAEGRRLELDVVDRRVVVRGAEEDPAHEDELRDVLLRSLAALGEEGDLSAEPLAGLVDLGVARSMSLRAAVQRACTELEEQFDEDLLKLGGALQARARVAVDWGTFTLLLSAAAEFDDLYEHVDVEVATRRWLRREWEPLRTVEEAKESVTETILRWLEAAREAHRQ